MNPNDIEQLIDYKIMTKFSIINKTIEDKIKSKFSLSIKYWYPTLITVIIFTVGAVWWFYSLLDPIHKDIILLKNSNPALALNKDPVNKFYWLLDLQLKDDFSKLQEKALIDISYELINQRKDLVVIIAGYTGKGVDSPKENKVILSEQAGRKVYNFLVSKGVSSNRLFYKGSGPDVPESFNSAKDINVCIMLCDVYSLMKNQVAL